VMLGTWAETAEQCAAKDKTNIVIEPTKYRDGGGDCAVRWIVEIREGSDVIGYAVHSFCISASLPEKTQTKNIIVRPLGPDRAAMGQSFDDLKNYSAVHNNARRGAADCGEYRQAAGVINARTGKPRHSGSSKFLNFHRAIHWTSNFHFGVARNYYVLRICLLYKSRM